MRSREGEPGLDAAGRAEVCGGDLKKDLRSAESPAEYPENQKGCGGRRPGECALFSGVPAVLWLAWAPLRFLAEGRPFCGEARLLASPVRWLLRRSENR